MTKYFISQPMNGKSQEEILARREFITDLIGDTFNGPIILDSFIEGAKDVDPLVCLGHAITIMSKADVVVFDMDWAKSRGCQVEHLIAEKYGKKIYYVVTDFDGVPFLELRPAL